MEINESKFFTRIIFGNSTEQQVVMTSAISIFAILMVVIINLSTNSGAVSEAIKSHHNLEIRKFRSLAKSATSKKGEFSSKNHHKLVQNGQKSDKQSQKKSAKKTQRSRKPIGQKKHKKSAKKTQKSEKPKGQKKVSTKET